MVPLLKGIDMGRIGTSGFLSLLLVACAISGTVRAEESSMPWHNDLYVAHSIAKALKRPLVVVVTTKACVACSRLKKTTLTDQKVVSEIRRSFVPATADAAKYPEFTKSLGIESYPTTVIIAPDLSVTESIIGYVTPERLQQRLRMATQVHVAQRPGSRVR
jgi:thiol:disulfide interchange protein